MWQAFHYKEFSLVISMYWVYQAIGFKGCLSVFVQHSPIILAAENGFAKCVELLLSKGANVNDSCPVSNYNSLMLAIAGKHR